MTICDASMYHKFMLFMPFIEWKIPFAAFRLIYSAVAWITAGDGDLTESSHQFGREPSSHIQ